MRICGLQRDRWIYCILTGLLMAVLLGCSSGSGTTASGGGTSPAIVLPSDPGGAATATLKGVDTNNNGIRDEVEIAISKIAKDQDDRTKLNSIAIEYQKSLNVANPNISEISNKVGCIELSRSAESRSILSATELSYLIFDTPERRAAFNALDGTRGTVTGSSDDLTCN